MTLLSLLQAASPPPGGESLAWNEVLGEYLKFAGYFLAIGAVGYRYLILPRFDRDSGGEAMIGRNAAATLGVIGVLLLILSSLGGIEMNALMHQKTFVASQPKAIARFQFQQIAGIRALVRAPAGIINAFTPIALTAATIVGVTGVTIAWLHVKHLANLRKTGYGIALIVKLCFVIAVVFIGWWNWKKVKPSLIEGDQSIARLNRSATTEVMLGAIVLAITAVLVSLPSQK